MNKVVIPETQEEAVQILNKRRQHHMTRTMYDMLLIRLAYCSEEEFNRSYYAKDKNMLIPCSWCNKVNSIEEESLCVNLSNGPCFRIEELDNYRFKEYRK